MNAARPIPIQHPRFVPANEVSNCHDADIRGEQEVAERDHPLGRPLDVAEVSLTPEKRHTIVSPAAASIKLSIPKAMSATDPAAIPAPIAIANSTTCQAFPPHARSLARRSSRALSTPSATVLMPAQRSEAQFLRPPHGMPALPGDLEDDQRDDEADDRVGDGHADRNDCRAGDHADRDEAIDTRVIAVGH